MGVFLIGFIAVVIVVWPILIYNRLVRLRSRILSAWSQMDVQLKRRHDLVPNLVSAVKGYMDLERETLEGVTAARARAVAAHGVREKGLAENILSDMLGRLFLVVENYPELRSSENVLRLQEELTTTENRIAFARQFYNDLVASFNARLDIFPDTLVAAAFSFSPYEYFSADVTDRSVPRADISPGK